MVFAKNSDRPPSEAQVLLAHGARAARPFLDTQYLRLADPGAYAFVGSHSTWLWGAEHGVNEHGVAIGNEKIWTVNDPRGRPPALLGMDLVRLGLERGRTADEALDAMTGALAEHGQGGSGEPGVDEPYDSSFLVTDARGGWVLETSARTWAARPVGDGSAISNRITLSTDWTIASADVEPGADFDRWRAPKVSIADADDRLAATRSCIARHATGRHAMGSPLAAGAPLFADIVATLRDHGQGPWGAPGDAAAAISPVPHGSIKDLSGITVCMHLPQYQATTASIVIDLPTDGPPRAWACLGNPCASVYVPFFPPNVPVALADPARWHRFAALRDRVEAEPGVLTAVRSVLAPVEAELWADADACSATGDPARFATFASTASARVDAALDALEA